MALNTKVGTFFLPATTQSVAITGLGFQPKLLFFWTPNASIVDQALRNARFIWGVSDGTAHHAMSMSSGRTTDEAGNDVVNALRQLRTQALFAPRGTLTDTTPRWEFTVDSLDADGFTLDFNNHQGSDQSVVAYMALGGSDITNIDIAACNSPTGELVEDVELGYTPDFVCFFSARTPADLDQTDTNLQGGCISLGFAAPANQLVMGLNGVALGAFTDTRHTLREELVAVFNEAGTSLEVQAFLNTFRTDGFTIDWRQSAPYRFIYVAVKGVNTRIGQESSPSRATRRSVTGIGFEPTAVFTMANTVSPTIPAFGAGATYSFAGIDAETSALMAATDPNGRSPQTQKREFRSRAVLIRSAAGLDRSSADLTNFHTDGFVLDWTASDPPAIRWAYVAFGPLTPVASAPQTIGNVTVFREAGQSIDTSVTVSRLVWSEIASTGHRLIIGESDALGDSANHVIILSSEDMSDSLLFDLGGYTFANGLQVAAIDSGRVFIYTGAPSISTVDTISEITNVSSVDTVDALTDITNPIEVTGDQAHDAAATSNPVQIAGRANETEPTRVADGDVVRTWHDLEGRMVTMLYFPARPAASGTHGPLHARTTSSGDTTLIATPGANQSIYVTGVHTSLSTAGGSATVSLREGVAGTYRFRTLISDAGNFSAPNDQFHYNPPWKLPANTSLVANSTATLDVDWTIQFYVAP